MSLNIYNPTTQQLTEVAGLDVKDSLEKVATLPTPTADYLNQVYILVGTQEGYHVGSIYQCRYINSAYTWVEITGSVVGKADKAPNATNNHLAKLTADGNLADSGIAVGDLGTAINKNWTDLVRPNSHDLVESNAVYSAITNAISSIYTPHGDITCAELVPALLIDENIGNVYTVTDSGTTTAYFMQGAGKTINTSDSVSIIKAGETTILFNLMGNVLDLTDYQKKNLSTAIEIGGVNKTTVEDALNGLNDHEEEDIEGIWKANGELGAKNLLLNKATTQTVNGVTFTVNTDGTVLVDGTATATIQFELNPSVYVGTGNKIIISGCPNVDSEYNIRLRLTEENTPTYVIDDIGESVTYEATADKYGCRIIIFNGYTANNLLFKPMIRLASDPDNTYEPYAMTNQQITPYVQAISNPNLLDNPWFTVNQRGQSSYSGTSSLKQYVFDRWFLSWASSDVTVTKNSDGTITYTNNSSIDNMQIIQIIDTPNALANKQVTLSIDVVSVTVASGNTIGCMATLNASPWTSYARVNISSGGLYSNTGILGDASTLSTNGLKVLISLDAGESITFKAIKLELGSVSTLAMDTAPNYATELLKCQRYFERNNWYDWGCITCRTAGVLNYGMTYPFLVKKRGVPTFTFNVPGNTGLNNGYLIDLTTNTNLDVSQATLVAPTAYNYRMMQMRFEHASLVVGHTYAVAVGDSVVDISADL